MQRLKIAGMQLESVLRKHVWCPLLDAHLSRNLWATYSYIRSNTFWRLTPKSISNRSVLDRQDLSDPFIIGAYDCIGTWWASLTIVGICSMNVGLNFFLIPCKWYLYLSYMVYRGLSRTHLSSITHNATKPIMTIC